VGWEGTESAFTDHFPSVAKNTASTIQTAADEVLLPGELIMHEAPSQNDKFPVGGDGAYAVIRFTAPTTGQFSLSAVFEGRETSPTPTTTDVHVLLNGVSLFDGAVNGFGPPSDQSFATTLALHTGDRLDFAVGLGNGSFLGDTTGLDATITNAVPEPSTFTMTGVLATCSGLVFWQRKRRSIPAGQGGVALGAATAHSR
jgi:hypothetical protein